MEYKDKVSKEFYQGKELTGLHPNALSHKVFAKIAFVISAYLLTGAIGVFICSFIPPIINQDLDMLSEISVVLSIVSFVVFLISTIFTYRAVVTTNNDNYNN